MVLTIGTRAFAQDCLYKEGSVWNVSFIKTNPGMDMDYLKSILKGHHRFSWRVDELMS